jgi:hypothetical protein
MLILDTNVTLSTVRLRFTNGSILTYQRFDYDLPTVRFDLATVQMLLAMIQYEFPNK